MNRDNLKPDLELNKKTQRLTNARLRTSYVTRIAF